jgi:hypothetical protein
MTLQECIARHEAHRAAIAEPIAVTPLGAAIVAANRLTEALKPLTDEQRKEVLIDVVIQVPGLVLLESRPPTRDPQLDPA